MSWFTVACNRFTIWVRGICDGLKGLPEVVGKPLSTVVDLHHPPDPQHVPPRIEEGLGRSET